MADYDTDEDDKARPGPADADDEVKDALEMFELIAEREKDNRREALDDLKFARLSEQWPDKVKQSREKAGRPCLTINKLPTFIRQVTNEQRQNRPSITVHPVDDNADPETAEIINGIIRNIEVTSNADIAYDTALEFAVTMGFGYIRVNTCYTDEDSFEVDLCIQAIENPFSVYGDPYSTKADSADWNCAFVTEQMARAEFRKKYKGAEVVDWKDEEGYGGLKDPWGDGKQVMVAEYWERTPVQRQLLMLSNGMAVRDDVFSERKDEFDAQQITVVGKRPVASHKVTQKIMSGVEVLDRIDWKGKYIPIIPVYGEVVNVEGKRHFRSLVRDAKDPQRNFNYWRTKATEAVALAPNAPYIGPKGSFKSDSGKWATANTETHAFMEYDPVGNAAAPKREVFAGIPAGALQEALNSADDMKAVMGIFDASLGARSNETSGVAIKARKVEGDMSNFHFQDNLSRSIRHTGLVVIDLMPHAFSGERVARIRGKQGEVQNVQLAPFDQNAPQRQAPDGSVIRTYDLARGKYDLTVKAGPSFSTMREEAAEQMFQLLKAFPQAAPFIGDLLVKNLDWPGADEIAKRLEKIVPQGGGDQQGAQGEGGIPPEAMQQLQGLVQELQAAQAKIQSLEGDKTLEQLKLKIDAFEAQTKRLKVATDAQKSRTQALSQNVPASVAA